METTERLGTKLSASVGKEIRKLLIDLDMKQSDLAARIGENEMWLSRRLRGANPIDLNELERIAEALNVEVADLLPRREGRVVYAGKTAGQTTVPYSPKPKRPGPIGWGRRPHPKRQETVRPSSRQVERLTA